jgi:GntR family transcriptional regulator, rspAB operon transcriptional repressor
MTEVRIHAARRRPTVATEVRAYLRRMIVRGTLPPGHPLSENEVAGNLGLSRTPVREAFIKLEEEGLIAIYPQYGTFVAPIRVADVYDSQFVRDSLECAALVKVIENLNPEAQRTIESMLAVQRRHLSGEAAPFFEADETFHATLMRIAGHARAWSVVEAAKGQHDRIRCLTVQDPLKRRAIFKEHSEIVERILCRDVAGAVQAMKRHLRGVFESVEIVMARHPDFFAPTAESALQPPKRPIPARREVPAGRKAGGRRSSGVRAAETI